MKMDKWSVWEIVLQKASLVGEKHILYPVLNVPSIDKYISTSRFKFPLGSYEKLGGKGFFQNQSISYDVLFEIMVALRETKSQYVYVSL